MSTERNWPVGEGGSGGCDSPRLDEAVRALREPVEVRAEWRDALLRELAAAPVPRRRPGAGALRALFGRRWSMTPAAAAAGALLCAGAGAGAAWWALRAPAPAVASGGHALGGSAVVRAASRAGGGAGVATVRFTLHAPGAERVSVVGDFNRWDPAATPLRARGDGSTWEVTVPLAPGRHVYAFVVDGGLTIDPAAPRAADDDFGTPNSIVIVSEAST